MSDSHAIIGPLRKNPTNPRYFATPDGEAVFLTGSHTWNNLQDKPESGTDNLFDWPFYLDFLAQHNHNFIRLWSVQMIGRHDGSAVAGVTLLPWQRTGPGVAKDGLPKIDLTKFNPDYFVRLRDRVRTARNRGIYVDVMMFEGWCASNLKSDQMTWHCFADGNNINGVNVLESPRNDVYARWVTMDDPKVVELQELHVKKVVEAVNEYDNVLYEVANEPSGLAHDWQEHFAAFIRGVESSLPHQHPVGIPGGMGSLHRRLFASDADWISPDINAPDDAQRQQYLDGTATWGTMNYDRGDKVIILDTDHLWGLGGNVDWAWKSFLRGYNLLYMDPAKDFPGAFFKGTTAWPDEPNHDVRRELGAIRKVSMQVDLNHTIPASHLCSTGYCLAHPGVVYICYQPSEGSFGVQAEPGLYRVKWHLPVSGETISVEPVGITSAEHAFIPPRKDTAVLILEAIR